MYVGRCYSMRGEYGRFHHEKPVWYAQQPYFQLGDWVQAVVNGKVKAEGHMQPVAGDKLLGI